MLQGPDPNFDLSTSTHHSLFFSSFCEPHTFPFFPFPLDLSCFGLGGSLPLCSFATICRLHDRDGPRPFLLSTPFTAPRLSSNFPSPSLSRLEFPLVITPRTRAGGHVLADSPLKVDSLSPSPYGAASPPHFRVFSGFTISPFLRTYPHLPSGM